MFIELIQYFFNNEDLCFRALVAKNKNKLNHNKYNNNDYDLWYYKMYYLLLDKICYPHFKYKIFIDIKDTRGGVRIKKLHEVLCNNRYDFMKDSIRDIQQINSNRSDLLQITDLLIGALSFYYRDLYNDVNKSVYKKQVVNTLISNVGKSSIDNGTNLTEKKFNIFIWEPRVV